MDEVRVDRLIEWLARRQHGVFSRPQALAAGCTPRMVQVRRAGGSWLTLTRGVYALNSAPFTWLRQAKAAELSIEGSALSHRAAAHLHGLLGHPAGPLDLAVWAGNRSTTRLATVHQVEPLSTTSRHQITVTSLPLTIVQLASLENRQRLERTIDDVLVAGLATHEELLAEAVRRSGGHPKGIGTLLELLGDRGSGYVPPTNRLEAALYVVLDDARLPPYERQASFPWWPAGECRVDAVIPSWLRIIEADGRRWHSRRRDFERDRRRDHQAQRHGYEVTRFTYKQLVESAGYAVELLLQIGRVGASASPAVTGSFAT